MSAVYKYKVKWSTRFKKEYKLAMKRGYDIGLLDEVIRLIARGDQQPGLLQVRRVFVARGKSRMPNSKKTGNPILFSRPQKHAV